jgi:Flp pilus assembly protein TadB
VNKVVKIVYVGLLLLVIVVTLIDMSLTNKKKDSRFRPGSIGGGFLTRQVGDFIGQHQFLHKLKMKYANKLSLVNHKTKRQNEVVIDEFILFVTIFSLVISFVAIRLFTMWYVFFIIFFVSLFFIVYLGTLYVSMKLNKIYSLFPMALQLFTDEYVSCKNIKGALNSSYYKMPDKISSVFEGLARRFASESDYVEVINDFTEGLDFVWGYAFAELLLLSYEGAGDISEDLIYLNELSNEEVKAGAETETALVSTKMVFVILNLATVVGLLFSLNFIPISKYLYLYTPTGNAGIIFWIGSIIFGLTTLTIMKYL